MPRALNGRVAMAVMLALAAVVGLVVAARLILLRDTATSVSVSEAVERFEGSTPGGEPATADGVRVPSAGVYSYDTRGGESFEAFISASHDYPATTTIAVSAGGCGVLMRWVVLEERSTEWELCPGRRGWGLAGFTDVHEFFGQRDERRYDCENGVAFRLRGSWSYRCTYESTLDDFEGEFVGLETVRVDGVPVSTIHVRERDRLSGREQGEGSSETWYRRSDGLIVMRRGRNRDRAPVPGGTGVYSESYEIKLSSLRPAG